MDSKFVLYY